MVTGAKQLKSQAQAVGSVVVVVGEGLWSVDLFVGRFGRIAGVRALCLLLVVDVERACGGLGVVVALRAEGRLREGILRDDGGTTGAGHPLARQKADEPTYAMMFLHPPSVDGDLLARTKNDQDARKKRCAASYVQVRSMLWALGVVGCQLSRTTSCALQTSVLKAPCVVDINQAAGAVV